MSRGDQFLGFALIVFFDLVYALILVYKLTDSQVPMSTTWVFIGLLGGREIAMRLLTKHKLKPAFRMIGKDAGLAIM